MSVFHFVGAQHGGMRRCERCGSVLATVGDKSGDQLRAYSYVEESQGFVRPVRSADVIQSEMCRRPTEHGALPLEQL